VTLVSFPRITRRTQGAFWWNVMEAFRGITRRAQGAFWWNVTKAFRESQGAHKALFGGMSWKLSENHKAHTRRFLVECHQSFPRITKRTQGALGGMSRKLRLTQTRSPYKALVAAVSRCDSSARNFSKSNLSARLARLAQQSIKAFLMSS
jgi:hypothetical protein